MQAEPEARRRVPCISVSAALPGLLAIAAFGVIVLFVGKGLATSASLVLVNTTMLQQFLGV